MSGGWSGWQWPGSLGFAWPFMLWGLAILPLVVMGYLRLKRRRVRYLEVVLPSLQLIHQAQPPSTWKRHVPPVLTGLSLLLLLLALARPHAWVWLPSRAQTVVLAMDVSLSMKADDVRPNRLVAAQEAARAFVLAQPPDSRMAVVAFAGGASVVQAPTRTRDEVLAAIDRFQLQRGTAIGSGLRVSLGLLLPGLDAEMNEEGASEQGGGTGAGAGTRPETSTPPRTAALDPASAVTVSPVGRLPGVVILLSDGQSTTGPDPLEAARLAQERGVRVYTVGVGTPDGEIVLGDGWRMRVRLDEQTLEEIARLTGGTYFHAGDAEALRRIYEGFNNRFEMEPRSMEITALFAAVAAVLMLASAGLSLRWFQRVL